MTPTLHNGGRRALAAAAEAPKKTGSPKRTGKVSSTVTTSGGTEILRVDGHGRAALARERRQGFPAVGRGIEFPDVVDRFPARTAGRRDEAA